MGSIMSREPEIDALWLEDFPNRKIRTVRAVRIGDHIYFEHEGRISVAVAKKTQQWAYPITFEAWPWHETLLQAASMFGLVSKAAVEREAERVRKADHKRKIERLQDGIKADQAELKKLLKGGA